MSVATTIAGVTVKNYPERQVPSRYRRTHWRPIVMMGRCGSLSGGMSNGRHSVFEEETAQHQVYLPVMWIVRNVEEVHVFRWDHPTKCSARRWVIGPGDA